MRACAHSGVVVRSSGDCRKEGLGASRTAASSCLLSSPLHAPEQLKDGNVERTTARKERIGRGVIVVAVAIGQVQVQRKDRDAGRWKESWGLHLQVDYGAKI